MTSALLRNGDGEDDQSIDFSVEADMLAKLDIRKPRRGEEFSTYELEKIYKYQLERDIHKIVEKRGSYAKRNAKFMQIRRTDAEFAQLSDPKPLGQDGDFTELLKYTIPTSWQATSKPYGIIAHKRYLEYLANLPKGPTEDEIKDKQQRKDDVELWAKIVTGRTEPTRKDIQRAEKERRKQELRERGLVDSDEDEYTNGLGLTKEEERKLHTKNADFEKLRNKPTRSEFSKSLKRWHRGVYFPYNTEKGFPIAERPPTYRDEHVSIVETHITNVNPTYTSANVLKGLRQNEKRYHDYLGQSNYEKAKEYLERRKDRLERAKVRAAKKKATDEYNRRRGGLQGVEIQKDAWQARLEHARTNLIDTVHVEENDGHQIHARKLQSGLAKRQWKKQAAGRGGGADEEEKGEEGDESEASYEDTSSDEDRESEEEGKGEDGDRPGNEDKAGKAQTGQGSAPSTPKSAKGPSTAPSTSHANHLDSSAYQRRPAPWMCGLDSWASDWPLPCPLKGTGSSRSRRYRVVPEDSASSIPYSASHWWRSLRERLSSLVPSPHRLQAGRREIRRWASYFFAGVPYKSSTQSHREHVLHQLQNLMDAIFLDSFIDDLLRLAPTELCTEDYVHEMNRKRRYFYSQITELTKRSKDSKEARQQLERHKTRLELFERTNQERLERQERVEGEIQVMKDILLEMEAEVVAWKETIGEKIAAWLIRHFACGCFAPKDPSSSRNKSNKKLAHLLPDPHATNVGEMVERLTKERIISRKEEHKRKARLARLSGLSYDPDLSRKTADDLVIAAECGDVNAVIDLLDKRDDIKDAEMDPRIPVNAVNTDGVTATFAVCFMILNREVLDTDMDFEELGLTRFQRLWRRIRRSKKKAAEIQLDVVLQILLHYGGSLDFYRVMEKDGFTMLHYAAMKGSVEMLEWLLERGVSVHQRTKVCQQTALMLAVERNHLDAVMCLLRHGAIGSIHAVDSQGNNILHYAARQASIVLVKILLLCGAQASVRNQALQLPAEKARMMNRFDVSRLLATFKTGSSEEVSRVEFLYNTELCDVERLATDVNEERDGDEEEEEAKARESEDAGTGGGLALLTASARANLGESARERGDGARNTVTETTLAMQVMRKRAQSYRVNKLWKQSLEESSRVVGPPPGSASSSGRRGSTLVLRPQSAGLPSTESTAEPSLAATVVRASITDSATTTRANMRLRSPLMIQANGEAPTVDYTKKRRVVQKSFLRPQSAKV